MLAYLLSLIDRILLSLLVVPIEKDLKITDTEFSLLTGLAFALLYSVAGVPIARIADRGISRSRIVGLGIIVWSLMTAISGFAQEYWELFLARVGVGIGEAALAPAAASIIADLFPREKLSKAMAVFTLGGILGSGAAYLLGGAAVALVSRAAPLHLPVIGALSGWRLAFVAVAMPGVIVAGLVFSMQEPQRAWREPAAEPGDGLLRFLKVNASAIAVYFAAYSCFNALFYGFITWLPALLIRRHQLDVQAVGVVIGMVLIVVGPVGAMLGGASADFLMRRGKNTAHMRINFLACVGITCFAVAMPLDSNWPSAIALLCGLYFSCSIVSAIGIAGLQLMTPPHLRAQVTAIFFLVINLFGITSGPAAIALLTDFVFRDPNTIHRSMALVGAVFPTIAAILFLLGTNTVGRSVCRQRFLAEPGPLGSGPAKYSNPRLQKSL
jgi:MFS family permease